MVELEKSQESKEEDAQDLSQGKDDWKVNQGVGEDAQFSDVASLSGEGYPEKGVSSFFV